MFQEGPCLIQGWMEPGINGIESIYSPSVQLFVNEKSIYIYDITEQTLTDESVHQGNISPPPWIEKESELKDEILNQAKQVGNWLYSQNYRGTGSIDFLVVMRSNEVEVIISEINARVTGATYPSILARHFIPGGAWIMRNLITDKPLLGEKLLEILDRTDSLFEPGKDKGFLPINFNLDEKGRVIKGQFLYLSKDLNSCNLALEELHDVFPEDWTYDRD